MYRDLEPGPSQIDLIPRQVPKRVIDSNNEQEFPSLGGPPSSSSGAGGGGSSSARQDNSIRSKAFKAAGGSGKITRTNENFPALGGAGGSSAGPAASSGAPVAGSYQKVSASAILKAKPATTSNGTEQSSVAKSKPGTVIHISNRPKDFPALGRGRNSAAVLEDQAPVVTQMMSQLHVNNSAISAKHRGLVDEYTIASAVGQKQTSKLAMVKAAAAPAPTSPVKAAPAKLKLKSEENFPSLGGGGGAPTATAWTAPAPKWVNKPSGNANKVESRKAKVAANPMSISSSETKKDKKQKATTTAANEQSKRAGGFNSSPLVANGLILGQNGPPPQQGKGNNNMAAATAAVPPPGFGGKQQATTSCPPPGFNVTLNSVSRNGGAGLMFTTSAGEKFKILPTRRYFPPPMIQKRNQVGFIIFFSSENSHSNP